MTIFLCYYSPVMSLFLVFFADLSKVYMSYRHGCVISLFQFLVLIFIWDEIISSAILMYVINKILEWYIMYMRPYLPSVPSG